MNFKHLSRGVILACKLLYERRFIETCFPFQTNDALVAPLLRLNNCRLEEAEKTLLAHGKHSELIILYQTKGQHTKALQLLREQAKQTDSSLRGYDYTKNYLQQLGEWQWNKLY